jgi:hypothetical protein
MAVGIVRNELDAAGLPAAAAASRDGAAARRMLALALVVEGVDRTTAARTCGMDVRDGPADFARLGASLQRGQSCGVVEPACRRACKAADGGAKAGV